MSRKIYEEDIKGLDLMLIAGFEGFLALSLLKVENEAFSNQGLTFGENVLSI